MAVLISKQLMGIGRHRCFTQIKICSKTVRILLMENSKTLVSQGITSYKDVLITLMWKWSKHTKVEKKYFFFYPLILSLYPQYADTGRESQQLMTNCFVIGTIRQQSVVRTHLLYPDIWKGQFFIHQYIYLKQFDWNYWYLHKVGKCQIWFLSM